MNSALGIRLTKLPIRSLVTLEGVDGVPRLCSFFPEANASLLPPFFCFLGVTFGVGLRAA